MYKTQTIPPKLQGFLQDKKCNLGFTLLGFPDFEFCGLGFVGLGFQVEGFNPFNEVRYM